jgi:hypothetical protein
VLNSRNRPPPVSSSSGTVGDSGAGLCSSGADLSRSQPEADLLPPEQKIQLKRIQLLGYGFLGV